MEKIQLIVEYETTADEEVLESIGVIKYRLPIIGACVLEVSVDAAKSLGELKCIKAVYETANILAQQIAPTGYPTGAGVNIAILDTGLCPAADFTKPTSRLVAFKDFVNDRDGYYDDNGHGTHVTGIACGSGYSSNGLHKGVAIDAGIIAIKILDEEGRGSSADVLAGLQWVADNKEKYNIRIANLSVGTPDINKFDPLLAAVEYIWDMGIVVTVAAGNNGPESSTVTSPGSSRKVITVGAFDDDAVSTDAFGERIKDFSGRGPTKNCIIKPDILAPGSEIISVRSKGMSIKAHDASKERFVDDNYLRMSGTSMAAPVVCGAIALMLEKNPALKPDDIKYALSQTAVDIHKDANEQGWGRLDIDQLISWEVENVREKSIRNSTKHKQQRKLTRRF